MRPEDTPTSAHWGLAAIYATSVLARTMVISLIPVIAYQALGTAQRVSELYFIASLFGIAISLALPELLSRIGRETVLAGAALAGAGSAVSLAMGSGVGLVLGLVLHALMVLAFENVMSLYVMQEVPRRALSAFEPRRIFLAGLSYAAGPWLGIQLAQSAFPSLPLGISAACALTAALLIMLFISQRTAGAPSAAAVPRGADFARFWSQPRLRLAWILTAMRAAWWAMFIVYVPIFAIRADLGVSTGGALVSLGSAFLLLAPVWGRLARRTGTRRMLLVGYAICGLCTVLVAPLASQNAHAAAGMLLAAALAMSVIDGMGNVTFLRAVRPHQRTRMTPIFTTYRDVGQIAAAGVFAVLLLFLPLPAVFVVAGSVLFGGAALCRHLPRRF
jgi:hypothetical protein